jgi:hypothetical protein
LLHALVTIPDVAKAVKQTVKNRAFGGYFSGFLDAQTAINIYE